MVMQLKFKCAQCRKNLEFFEIHYLPGQTIYDAHCGLTYNTGQKYCEDCYKAFTEVHKTEEKEEVSDFSDLKLEKIDKLELHQKDINIVVEVVKRGDKREILKNGRKLYLSKIVVKDETGEIELILWNEIIDEVKDGDTLLIENGYVNEFQGKKQLTLGKQGKLKKINDS
tara:strand:- start:528 stop:1037 length:510 start_codon:yes stop_codon:yes gene_type:complete